MGNGEVFQLEIENWDASMSSTSELGLMGSQDFMVSEWMVSDFFLAIKVSAG